MAPDLPLSPNSGAPKAQPIVEDARLESLCRDLRQAGSFALDTEFIRERTYRPRLCLLQVATGTGASIVDPLLVSDLSPFLDLIFDPGVEKILHSGEQDMEIFFALGRRVPRNIFDTQVAAAMAGHGESVSYGRLVEDLCGVRLGKGETYTDWARRPLSPEQIEYALGDVRYLLPMAETLRCELAGKGRVGWVAEELRFYEEKATYERSAEDAFRRVRGANRLSPRELAVLRALAAWREEEAETMDWPRGRIVADEVLVEFARRSPRTMDALGSVRNVHPQLVRRSGKEVLRRVAAALALPPSELPQPAERPTESPEREAIADLLDVVVRARAAELEIAPSYIATRKDLVELFRRELGPQSASGNGAGPPLPLLAGWRRSLVGETVLAVLRGEGSVEVSRGRGGVEISRRGHPSEAGTESPTGTEPQGSASFRAERASGLNEPQG
jgi:ribonuclease D